MKSSKFPLYLQILAGLFLGLIWGIVDKETGTNADFTLTYIKPIGKVFLEALKYLALPLVIVSVTVGVTNIKDITKLSRLGGKTVFLYTLTTIIAIIVGIVLVDIIQPGNSISDETRTELLNAFQQQSIDKQTELQAYDNMGPVEKILHGFPENIVSKMLYFVLFALGLGILLVLLKEEVVKPVIDGFVKVNNFILKIVDWIMLTAPIGVFALIASLVVETHSHDLLFALLKYSFTVVLGLAIMVLVVYPLFLKFFSIVPIKDFYEGLRPAQLLAFSSSSSSATLPVTMKQCERSLKLPEQVTSFVLPLGATINMDGTSLYQAVAAIFIAQTFGIDLSIGAQLGIIVTALVSSVGSAGVPGAGMIMLGIVLQSENIPMEGIALIMAPDRILDMCRSAVNITGDATIAAVISKSEQDSLLA